MTTSVRHNISCPNQSVDSLWVLANPTILPILNVISCCAETVFSVAFMLRSEDEKSIRLTQIDIYKQVVAFSLFAEFLFVISKEMKTKGICNDF